MKEALQTLGRPFPTTRLELVTSLTWQSLRQVITLCKHIHCSCIRDDVTVFADTFQTTLQDQHKTTLSVLAFVSRAKK